MHVFITTLYKQRVTPHVTSLECLAERWEQAICAPPGCVRTVRAWSGGVRAWVFRRWDACDGFLTVHELINQTSAEALSRSLSSVYPYSTSCPHLCVQACECASARVRVCACRRNRGNVRQVHPLSTCASEIFLRLGTYM